MSAQTESSAQVDERPENRLRRRRASRRGGREENIMLMGIIAMSERNIATLMRIIAMLMGILQYIAMSVTIIDSSTNASVAHQ